jgi:hypothetical protein
MQLVSEGIVPRTHWSFYFASSGFESVPEPLARFAGSRARPAGSQKLGLRPREIGLVTQSFIKRSPQHKNVAKRYIYLFLGVLSIACLVSLLFLGVTGEERKASESSQPKIPFRRITSNTQLAARCARKGQNAHIPTKSDPFRMKMS